MTDLHERFAYVPETPGRYFGETGVDTPTFHIIGGERDMPFRLTSRGNIQTYFDVDNAQAVHSVNAAQLVKPEYMRIPDWKYGQKGMQIIQSYKEMFGIPLDGPHSGKAALLVHAACNLVQRGTITEEEATKVIAESQLGIDAADVHTMLEKGGAFVPPPQQTEIGRDGIARAVKSRSGQTDHPLIANFADGGRTTS